MAKLFLYFFFTASFLTYENHQSFLQHFKTCIEYLMPKNAIIISCHHLNSPCLVIAVVLV